MDDNLWESGFQWKQNSYYGRVSSLEEAKCLIDDFEYATCTSFSEVRSTKNFGRYDISGASHFIRFSDDTKVQQGSPIPSDGEAFIITGLRLLECHQGPDHRKSTRVGADLNNVSDDHSYRQAARKKKVTGTKKLGCSASICIREVIKFPEYKPSKNTHYCRDACSLKLRRDLESPQYTEIRMEKGLYIDLPRLEDHAGHLMGDAADLKAPIDDRVNAHIKKLASENITNTNEIQRNVKMFVKGLFGCKLPQNLNRRFYPSREDIRKIVYREKKRLMEGKLDQEKLKEKIMEWAGEGTGNIVCSRFKEKDEENSPFLLIFQSEWQRRLLAKYGTEMVFLDATYRTTRYALPLFFLCVYTNCGYYIVASILIENEDAASLSEAFEKLKESNDGFSPTAFMVDSSEIEMNAIRISFPEANTFICDFHRKQAWVRWTNASKIGVTDCKEKVLSLLNSLAESISEEEFDDRLKELRSSEIWETNERLRNYIERQWLPKYQSWVWAYRGIWLTLVINTNNGVEAQNKVFKYEYLTSYREATITRLMQCLIEEYFVDQYRKYLTANINMSSGWRTPAEHIPADLQHRPLHLLQHMKEVDLKALSIPAADVTRLDDISYLVSSSDRVYPVCLGNESTMPSCECRSFRRTHMPCKHFGAIFRHVEGISFSSLPEIYRGNPIFNLDTELFNKTETFLPGFVSVTEDFTVLKDIENDNVVVGEDSPSDVKTPMPSSSLDAHARRVREALATIHGLSFLVESQECLEKVKQKLDTIISSMKAVCPESGGLILEKKETKKTPVLAPLPTRKRRKQRASKEEESAICSHDIQEDKHSNRVEHSTRSAKRQKLSLKSRTTRGVEPKKEVTTGVEDTNKADVAKTVRWSDNTDDYIDDGGFDNNTDIDVQKAKNEAEKIWSWSSGTAYIVARAFKYNVTDDDIRSLDHGQWLTDQVIDAYLAHLTQAEFDKGRKVKHEAVSTMTSIINDTHKPKRNEYRVDEYDMILGAYYQRDRHWDLVVIEPKKRVINFYNPMGETLSQRRQVLQKWKNFLGRTSNSNKKENWTLETPIHSKQTDSFNCGMYTLMFAENHLLGKECKFEKQDVAQKRKEVAATLLLYEACVKDCCPCCGYKFESHEEVMQCGMCQKNFHKTPYCIGDDLVASGADTFLCKRCQYNVQS